MKLLLPIAWTLWGASLLSLVYWLHYLSSSRASGYSSLRDLLAFIVAAVIVVELLAGGALYWASTRLSVLGITIIAGCSAIPLGFILLVRSIDAATAHTTARNREQLTSANAAIGDFPDPALHPHAAAITAADPAALKQALTGPAPAGKDRAGHDLLNYALRRYRFDNGSIECIRLLLAAGANPNSPDPITGNPPLIELGEDPAAVRLLVEAGADIETNSTGLTPVVRFTMLRNWDSAIYLVKKGARLDTSDGQGVSLNYFLKEWEDSVNDQHPEGWDRLRAAITSARRANPSAAARPKPQSPSPSPAAPPR